MSAPKAKAKAKAVAIPLPTIPPEFDLDVKALKAKVLALRDDAALASTERVQAATDRDAVERFFDITKRELRESELEAVAKERALEAAAANHALEVRVYDQKARHLEFEHASISARIIEETSAEARDEVLAHRVTEAGLRVAQSDVRARLRAAEDANAEVVRTLKLVQEKSLAKLRSEFANTLDALRVRYEARLATLRADLSLRAKVEVHEVEERRNLHTHALSRAHEEAFAEMKRYYNDITRSNLALIDTLKAQISATSDKASANQKLVLEIAQENRRLSEPLQQALSERAALAADLKDAVRDRQSMEYARQRLASLRSTLHELKGAHSALEARYTAVETARNELYERFEATVQATAARAEARTAALEARLASAEDEHAAATAAADAVVTAAALDPAIVGIVGERLDHALEGRNRAIRELMKAAATLSKAHDDAVRTLSAKLVELGVAPSEASAGQSLLGPALARGELALPLSAAQAAALGGGAAYPGASGLVSGNRAP